MKYEYEKPFDYIKSFDEFAIPIFKILVWLNIIEKSFSKQYDENNKKLLARILVCAQELEQLIPNVQLLKTEFDQSHAVTHIIGGRIMTISGYTKLILSDPVWKSKEEQSEDEREHIRYLMKIYTAAEYLSSLNMDIVLRMMINNLHT